MDRSIVKSSRHITRYVANFDFMEEVIKPRISSWREELSADLDAMDEVDDVMREATLAAFDRFMDETKDELSHKKNALEKRFDKARRVFEKNIKPKILSICLGIHESKYSAKHGGALGNGFKPTDKWRRDVSWMLSQQKSKTEWRAENLKYIIMYTFSISAVVTVLGILVSLMGLFVGMYDTAARFFLISLPFFGTSLSSLFLVHFHIKNRCYREHVAHFIHDLKNAYQIR